MTAASSPATIDIEALGLDQGGLLLIRRALARQAEGAELRVRGASADWDLHLRAWCRQQGHGLRFEAGEDGLLQAVLSRHRMAQGRWRDALATGHADAARPGALADAAAPEWGLAARGVRVEAGSPAFAFSLRERHQLWADTAADLYAQAAAAQWDPATAVDWAAAFELGAELEAAVVQLMDYLVENENAALLLPARHLGQIHPHYREVMQLLALQCADEARHVEVFSRRAQLRGGAPGRSTPGRPAALKSQLDAPDFYTP
ncbi:MAG: ferritin-like domain-containing protein, partial [Burkholderiaceae bacterium]